MKGGIACSVAGSAGISRRQWRKPKGLDLIPDHRRRGRHRPSTAPSNLLQWVAARGEKFDHCVLGEPSNVVELGDCIKIGRRGSLSGTLYVDGIQGHVAYPHRAPIRCRDIASLIVALSNEPLDHGSAQFQASNARIHLGRCRQ